MLSGTQLLLYMRSQQQLAGNKRRFGFHTTWDAIRECCSHLFQQASPSVATFLPTDQPSVVGSYLKGCFAQRQTVLASPL